MTLQVEFRERFKAAFDASRFKSLRQLSKESECNFDQASKIARGDFDNSKDGPGLIGVHRMCEKMGVALSDLLPPTHNNKERPGISAFFDRHRGDETSIYDYFDILDYCDFYEEPKMGRCTLVSQGHNSLLTLKTGLVDVEKQQAEYDSWSPEKRSEIFNFQRRAFDTGILAEKVFAERTYGFHGLDLKGSISRAAGRVFGHDLKPGLLLYAEMSGQQQRRPSNQERQALLA